MELTVWAHTVAHNRATSRESGVLGRGPTLLEEVSCGVALERLSHTCAGCWQSFMGAARQSVSDFHGPLLLPLAALN